MSDAGDAIHVLHVDSDEDFLEVASTYLEDAEADIEVHAATSPEAGLRELARTPVDCVVSDHRPSGIDGLSFLSDVREFDPEMPFVLYTGDGSERLASEAISAGATDYVPKRTATEGDALLANTVVNAVRRRRAGTARDESQRRYRQLIEQSHDGIFACRGEEFTFVNDRLCEITGYDRAELLGTDPFELVHPDDRGRLRAYADRRRGGDPAPSRYRARIHTADGEPRHLEFGVSTATVDGEDAVLGSVRDVTERRRHETRLAEFASIVSHDLRNPLNVVAGRVELAEETGDETHFEAIARGVDTLDDLISELRTLADNAVPVTEPELVDVGAVAESAWRRVGRGDVTLSVADGLGRVEADPDRLELLLGELFENAVVHGGSSVRLERTDDGFAVADDGPGIDERDRDRVFESGYTRSTDRHGFGLTVVDWTAQAHGWTARLAETESGTRVEITGVTWV